MTEPLAVIGAAGAGCPVCGSHSLSQPGAGEVCRVCGWPDRAEFRTEPDRVGPGGESLNEARANVERFGVAFPPAETGGA